MSGITLIIRICMLKAINKVDLVKQVFKEHKFLALALLIYLSGVIVDSFIEYTHQRDAGLDHINEQLLTTVGFAETILNEDLVDHGSVSIEEEYELANKLRSLAERMRVRYIYSLTKSDDIIKFIVSNHGANGNSITKFKRMFLTEYTEAPEAAFEAFAKGEVKFSQFHDHWGDFRSIFFPLVAADGHAYVIGVDIKISRVLENARQSVYKALVYALFLSLMVLPLIYSYIRTVHRHYQEKLKAAQMHPITGLPNKRSLEFDLNLNDNNTLILIEIENFEAITNVIGVAAADSLILKLSWHFQELDLEGLSQCRLFHLEDNLFALHGDDTLSKDQVNTIASTVYHLMDKLDLEHQDEPIPLLLRMGSVFNQPNAFVLVKMAMTHAKKINQSIVMYDEALDLPLYFRKYILILNQISEALSNDRIHVYYQPIFDAHTGRVIKYEALARITDADGNITCLPDQFMPIAYQSRLCNELTLAVLNKVIETLKTNRQVVSINLSVKDLFDQKTRNHIVKSIKRSRVGKQIEFELLEQQVISNYRLAAEYIKELRDHCGGVGIDDMGKLYSNFDRLLLLPVDFVKIDGVVIESIERDDDAKVLVDGIINFARKKQIKVVAEYCTNESIYNMVCKIGVDMIQGFYLGKPEKDFQSREKQSKT